MSGDSILLNSVCRIEESDWLEVLFLSHVEFGK